MITGIDGVDHINIYSKGKTPIGRWLSHFTFAPFVHPRFGKFFSVEGFWYWRLSAYTAESERLRVLCGYSAKQYGRELTRVIDPDSDGFKEDIVDAEIAKLDAHPKQREEFLATTLPLVHYYEYQSGRVLGSGQWVIEELSRLRDLCR
jgi:hypothetical protein